MAFMDGGNSTSRFNLRNHTRLGMFAGGAAVIATALVARTYWGANRADAKAPPAKKSPPATAAKPAGGKPAGDKAASERPQGDVRPASATQEQTAPPEIVANVNGENISRTALAKHTMEVFGIEVLQNLINRQLILQACKERNVSVTRPEVDQEIDQLAQRFALSTDRYLEMLKEERGVTPTQYAKDIIWPMLALRKLSQGDGATEAEVRKAFEAKYGPAVKARLIAIRDPAKAKQIQAKAAANPDDFASLAKQHSDDPSNILGGIIQPIRLHMGNEEVEKIAFRLQPGQVSGVIKLADQYIILKCDQQMPAMKVSLEKVRKDLEAEIREGKERKASNDVFKEIQQRAEGQTKRYFKTDEAKAAPGVAAVVGDRKITMQELGEACIERHGEAVLDDIITRRILEQAVKRQKVVVTQQEIDEEIARAARSVAATDKDGNELSVEEWLDTVTKQQGVSVETYVHDAVWPSVALKKLVRAEVQVSELDLQKGFEANYGPRVRCLAIVLDNQRRAQEVWQKARDKDTAEYFGELAEQYSIEESSKHLRGEVPPIQKHGGQPLLEREAFTLKPGELSGLITMGDKYVILRCIELTEPVDVKFAEVKDELMEDIFEKKLRLAMADRLSQIKEESQIDNILAGTSQSPKKRGGGTKSNPEGVIESPGPAPSINGGPRTSSRTSQNAQPSRRGK